MATLALSGKADILRAMLLDAARDLADKSGTVTVTFDSAPSGGTVGFTSPSGKVKKS